MNRKDIIKKVKDAGVVGTGGAGFPTHIKINTEIDYVIANGLECEPLLKVDQHLMTLFPKKIISGLQTIMKATKAKKGFIALKKKYSNAALSLQNHIKNKQIEIKLLDNFYPAGDEQNVVFEIIKKVVPEAGIPLNIGAVVQNIGTLYNVHNAINNIPVVNKLVTVTGEVKKPRTYYAAIGTPIKKIINLSEISIKNFIILNGGPLMGNLADYNNDVITKTTSCLIVLSEDSILAVKKTENINKSIKLAKTLCIQCNTCTENCPRNALGHDLKPHLLMRKIGLGKSFIDESFADAYLCSECGVCGLYACPMGLLPHKVIKFIKMKLLEKNVQNKHLNQNPKVKLLYNEKRIPTDKIVKRLNIDKYYHLDAPITMKKYDSSNVRIPLLQHIGKPAIPVVKEGQHVNKYQLIADIKNNELGAKIHSSIKGRVSKITQEFVEIKK